MPRCLGASGSVRASRMPQSAVVGLGRPHLLAVDHPLVAVAHGPGGEAGEVGAGAGLAEQLAPDLVAAEHRVEEALLLRVGAVGDDRRADHADADHERARSAPRSAPAPGRRSTSCIDGAAPAAVLLRPGDAGPAAVVERRAASAGGGDVVRARRMSRTHVELRRCAGRRWPPARRGPRPGTPPLRGCRRSPCGVRSRAVAGTTILPKIT